MFLVEPDVILHCETNDEPKSSSIVEEVFRQQTIDVLKAKEAPSGPREIQSTYDICATEHQSNYDGGQKIQKEERNNTRFQFRSGAKQPLRVRVGEKVKAKWRGEGCRWFPALILKIWDHGTCKTFDIQYEDGASEKQVQEEFVRKNEL